MTQIEEAVSKLAEQFQHASEGLFSFGGGGPTIITRDRGVYAYLYAKPSKRMSQILSADREILLLASTFTEQQQRTVKVARDLIASSDGRLEFSLAIVLHADVDGNLKMQAWGRDVGLSILPIYSQQLPNSPVDLERYLARELFSNDPFDITGPVSDDATFFGRKNEAQELARKLQIGQIRSCLGMRKTGKTSIINRVIKEARTSHDCYSIFVDCSREEIWPQTPEQLMISFAEAVTRVISDSTKYTTISSSRLKANLAEGSTRLQHAISRADKPLLIFIDEIDYITPSSPTGPHWRTGFNSFWRNFRAVYQESSRLNQKVSVMVGGVSSKWFSVGEIEGIENAALLFIPEEYLSPLDENASISMIQKIAKTSGLGFSNEVASLVASSCGNIPFWIRKACSYVHRNTEIANRPLNLELNRVQHLIKDFISKEGSTLAHLAIQHLFRVYPELEKEALASLDPASYTAGPNAPSLARYGVLSDSNPRRPSGQMIDSALRAYAENKVANSRPDLSVFDRRPLKRERTNDQWADDLAVINKDRNLLERSLRQLALNFLRQDAVVNKSLVSTRDRINACTATHRKAKLSSLSAQEVVEELMWHELTSVIMREWKIFGAVFIDKTEFERHRMVVNDRYDAHAKETDVIDIAHYRNSVKWISDKVAAI